MSFWTDLWVKNNLHNAMSIPQLNKDEPTQVSSPLNPTQQGHLTACILFAQISTIVCSFQVPQKVNHLS
jgi:hypothetical protein